jgi:hypothetical protein
MKNLLENRLKFIFNPDNKKNLIILFVLILTVVVLSVFMIKRAYNSMNSIPLPEGCSPGDKFSQTTGRQCKDELFPSCLEGDLFDRNTGEPCVKIES